MADTRKASRAAAGRDRRAAAGTRSGGACRPGARWARSARRCSIMTACGSAGSKMRPARTLTRFMDTPSPPEGSASATRSEYGDACGSGQGHLQEHRRRRPNDTCGRRQRLGSSRRTRTVSGLDQQVRGMAAAQEARVGGARCAGARRSGHRSRQLTRPSQSSTSAFGPRPPVVAADQAPPRLRQAAPIGTSPPRAPGRPGGGKSAGRMPA